MKGKTVSISLTTLIILSLLLGGLVTTVVATDTGALAFDKELISWMVGSEPLDLKFDLKLKITNVTGAVGAVWSIRYNSSLFTVEVTDLSVPPPSDHWLYPLGVGGSITSFPIYDHLDPGELGEVVQMQISPFSPKTFTDPNWGWVATITFHYIGPSPTIGFPIDTDITIVNDPGASCTTAWTTNGITWIDYENLGECHFHYESALGYVHLESEEDTGASTNLGTITFDDVSYSLPVNVSKTVGSYSAEYFADAIYMFYHWETTGMVSVTDANANPTTVTVSGDGTLKAIYASHHIDHLNDYYVPMVIPVNGKNLTIAPVITCTILENGVFKPFHHPCKSAQTNLTDDDWSDGNANYTYVFEDWVDYDWNDIVVSLYAITNNVTEVEIHLDSRDAVWKNPFGVEITPMGMDVRVHWNSTDYPEEHIIEVNCNQTVDIELFDESIPGITAFIVIVPLIPPTASFVYSPLQPEEGQTVTFDASASTPGEGTIISYYWIFGDGETDTGKIVTHTYTTAGTYTVTLNVTNGVGKWDTESKQITVKPKPPPVGGYAIPIKIGAFNLLTPQISLALSFLAAMAVTVILIRRRNKTLKREH